MPEKRLWWRATSEDWVAFRNPSHDVENLDLHDFISCKEGMEMDINDFDCIREQLFAVREGLADWPVKLKKVR